MKNTWVIFFLSAYMAMQGQGCYAQKPNVDPALQAANGTIILLDRYFNSEQKKDSTGQSQFWHYTWEEKSDPGFSALGDIFRQQGAILASIDHAPRASDLQKAGVYIIVDPDHVKDKPHPNYITTQDAEVITAWVRKGGVLLLMANDSANCDLQHLDQLSQRFGIRFTNKSVNMVKNDVFETGLVLPLDTSIFKHSYKMFLKDVSSLEIQPPANPIAVKNDDVFMATSGFGKGIVFAVGDPWLYNEYVVGKRLPAEYENNRAATDLVRWILKQASVNVAGKIITNK